MILKDQDTFLELFHAGCVAITKAKSRDYAPDGIPLLDTMRGAVEADITVPQALWQLYNKHFAAIRGHFFLNKPITSDSPLSRCQDATNLFAFLALYESHKMALHETWLIYWSRQTCTCGLDEHARTEALARYPKRNPDWCSRCHSLYWLVRKASAVGLREPLWPMTVKARVLSHTETPLTGDIIPRGHSDSRSATSTDIRPGSAGGSTLARAASSLAPRGNKKRSDSSSGRRNMSK
jgi:hypothetical protein